MRGGRRLARAGAARLEDVGEMMRGLVKATHYYSTQQARADWAQLAAYANARGHGAAVVELEPPQDAGHKTIDKRINALMVRMGLKMPFYQWQQGQQEPQP